MGEPENLKLIYLILNLYMGSFSTYEEEIESAGRVWSYRTISRMLISGGFVSS